MRPQQQNRRMRGRGGNNNNRKGPNPLNRSYESNGPDVKIRGTAQQVADKYSTLARDAQSMGDRVIAENYLQHAEHYNRIIAAAQAQQQAQQQNQPQQSTRDNRDDADGDGGERDYRGDERDNQEEYASSGQSRQRIDDGSGPQPEIEGVPVEVAMKEGRKNSANGAKRNGHDTAAKANGAEPEAKSAESGSDSEAAEGEPEEKPKPKRARRPRAKKTEEPAESGEAKSEEAATAE